MSIGELCNREVVMVGRDDTVREVVLLMRRHHVGDVIVVERHGDVSLPVGILTDRDIVIEILAEDVNLDAVVVGDVMSGEPLLLGEGTGVGDGIERMRGWGVRRAPVVNADGALVGIVTLDDLLEWLAGQLGALARLTERELARERALRR